MTAKSGKSGYDHHRGHAPLLRPAGRWRTACFLAINLAGFAVVNAFWQYLVTGQWARFTVTDYIHDIAQPVGGVFAGPLGISTHPWMILAAGVLLGVVIFVPVIMSVLYRLSFAAAFVVIIAIIGHAPVLALSVAAGCFVAGRTSLRSDMPFLAAVLGLLPAGVYLYLSSSAGMGPTAVLPIHRCILYAPLLVAFVSAVLAEAVALTLARASGFRPGVVWPVLAILLAGPMAIFYAKVGPDELHYAILAGEVSPDDAILEPVAMKTWRRIHGAEGLDVQRFRIRLLDDLHQRRSEMITRCGDFLGRHPRSDRAADVLWLSAQCQSLQVDFPALDSGLVRYTAGYVMAASQKTWQRLYSEFAASPQAAIAGWRLGELALRQRDVAEAYDQLHTAAERLRQIVASHNSRRALGAAGLFGEPESVPSLGYYQEALFSVERLVWLMERNDVLTDKRSAEALGAYLRINPHEDNYLRLLSDLLNDTEKQYEKTGMGDNLKLFVALAIADRYMQAEMLLALAADERTDAAVEANYELGRLAMQEQVLQLIPGVKKPQDYFRQVIAAPANPWQRLAVEHLGWLDTPPANTP